MEINPNCTCKITQLCGAGSREFDPKCPVHKAVGNIGYTTREKDRDQIAAASELRFAEGRYIEPPKPNSASTGKDLADELIEHFDKLPFDYDRMRFKLWLRKKLTPTPSSGGEKWTEEWDKAVVQMRKALICLHLEVDAGICADLTKRFDAVEAAHNATLQPIKFIYVGAGADDTKRLDWLCAHATDDFLLHIPDRLASTREYIDAAMRKDGK